ncbi:hypothetical protein PRK78_005747 [Emydomyces testavorans]|uniref:Uncharacterized protein n=1 Tax=Emydomyces testavorans TaxID=2070801 RepID=A0AAF0DMB1_9EURO|nr:hypothetical protein PRK78_005747 [Emydomyces testavorans]
MCWLPSPISRWVLGPSKETDSNPQKPPKSPRELLRGRLEYEIPLLNRVVEAEADTPLAALYRIYEHIMLDQHLNIRNEFETFWFHSDWKVYEIQDPRDPDPERYAVLACIPALLCLAFNKRIELGLPRDAPPIFSHDQLDEWKSQERQYEKEPAWAESVPALHEPLAIPHWDNDKREFVALDGFENDNASKEFAKKNILIWQPHIHFV